MRSGQTSFLAQNTILLGIFFTLPLYFQIVLGFDALETGIRMLPISIAMFVTSASGPALAQRFAPRRIVQAGFVTLVAASFLLLGRIGPDLDSVGVTVSLTDAIAVEVGSGASFVPAEQVDRVLVDAGVDPATAGDVVAGYEDAQLQALKVGLLVAALIAAGALLVTRGLPEQRLDSEDAAVPDGPSVGP